MLIINVTVPPASLPVKKAEAVVEHVVEVDSTIWQVESAQSGAPS